MESADELADLALPRACLSADKTVEHVERLNEALTLEERVSARAPARHLEVVPTRDAMHCEAGAIRSTPLL